MRIKSILAATGLLAAFAVFTALPAAAQQAAKAPNAPVCANCHEAAHTSIMLTAHGAGQRRRGLVVPGLPRRRQRAPQGPEQGQAGQRAEQRKGATAAEKSAVCMACHAGSRHLEVLDASKHRKVDVTCVNCHNIHGTQTRRQSEEHQFRVVRGLAVHDDRRAACRTRSASSATATRAPRS